MPSCPLLPNHTRTPLWDVPILTATHVARVGLTCLSGSSPLTADLGSGMFPDYGERGCVRSLPWNETLPPHAGSRAPVTHVQEMINGHRGLGALASPAPLWDILPACDPWGQSPL